MIIAPNIICIEGPDFSGKTSVVKELCLEYPELTAVRSPGGTVLGEKMREIIKSCRHSNLVERMLFNLSDISFFEERYSPEEAYVFDRYWLSRLAYQSSYVNVNYPKVADLVGEMTRAKILFPALTIVLLAEDPKILLKRATSGGRPLDNFEQNLPRLNEIYFLLTRVNNLPLRHVLHIDNLSIKEVAAKVSSILKVEWSWLSKKS
jgi:thymidylate kinase